jgi:hypothetical protein
MLNPATDVCEWFLHHFLLQSDNEAHHIINRPDKATAKFETMLRTLFTIFNLFSQIARLSNSPTLRLSLSAGEIKNGAKPNHLQHFSALPRFF